MGSSGHRAPTIAGTLASSQLLAWRPHMEHGDESVISRCVAKPTSLCIAVLVDDFDKQESAVECKAYVFCFRIQINGHSWILKMRWRILECSCLLPPNENTLASLPNACHRTSLKVCRV